MGVAAFATQSQSQSEIQQC